MSVIRSSAVRRQVVAATDCPELLAFLVWLAPEWSPPRGLDVAELLEVLVAERAPYAVVHHYTDAAARADFVTGSEFLPGDAWRRLRSRCLWTPVASARLQRVNAMRGRDDLHEGLRVRADGRPGVVCGANGGYVEVLFDHLRHAMPCHPHDVLPDPFAVRVAHG